ncbi:nickel-responsive transcriptional regulator NikR [Azospirillum sp.]|uniref:nickel-responsive transcriptional regulator NikR n=1 Tax=Azospirillum sp. TaxID=34012 RepID=UPI002D599501|nr:nickel-responsive transcriptional regulator NikR [Azospirillum sp.]HYD65834.1 nickel-responsive transcriptional regulator NikR [Azospirillum sp.]
MERVTVSLDEDLLAQFDELIRRRGYANRSEAVRDLIRAELEAERLAHGQAQHCIASLSYVFNHHERELARRLTQAQHDHHDLTLSTMHVHLDHDNCMEVTVLRGPTDAVRAFADSLTAERGVRHGQLNIVPADINVSHHHSHAHGERDHSGHGHGHGGTPHVHSHPKT